MSQQQREVSIFHKLSYGVGELFNATSVVIVLMLYLKFLTDVVGLSPFWAGVCAVAGQVWDAINDPLVGSISDRTRSRFGRRRVYFLLFAAPTSLSFVSMWLFLGFDELWAKVLYYALAYVMFKTFASLLMVPYQALGPELARGYDERTSVIVFRMVFSPIGAIVAGVVPNLIVRHYAETGRAEQGHLVVALVFGSIYLVIWLWIFAVLRERGAELAKRETPLLQSLKLTFKNRSARIVLGLYLSSLLAVDVLTASTKYFVDEYLRRPTLMPLFMGVMLGCATLSLPGYFLLIRRHDRRTSYVIGAVIWSAGLLGLFAVPADSPVPLLITVMVPIGVGIGAAFVAPWSMVPEVLDIELLCTGRAEEGVLTGIMTFLRKAATSVALFGLATSLELFGYLTPAQLGGGSQPPSALTAIHCFSMLVPAALVLASMLVAIRYPVTKRVYDLVRHRLDADRGRRDPLTEEETRELDSMLEKSYGRATISALR